jgi:predicted nuclease of predicted toxin-antitoxin system
VRLKLDENLGRSIAAFFRAAGHDTSTVLEQRLGSADDQTVFAVCARERRVLITLDLDFANPSRSTRPGRLAL